MIVVMVLALVGCRIPGAVPTSTPTSAIAASEATVVPALTGRVLFVAERQAQASMTDVAVAATVSLINTGSNQTVATTLTNAAGQFVLSFGKDFQPDPSAVYYLEAIKGLDNNRPSSNVARVRTLARFQSSAWTTLTAGGILISRSTTALSIGAALKQGTATPVDFSALIGKLEPGATSEQDVYTPVANLSGADFTALLNLVTTNLTADRDPVATLGYNAGTSAWVNMSSGGGSGFTVTSATPATGGAGTSVTIAGTGFSTTVASNSVTFAGTTATVTAATATSLTTTVPTGAVSGQVVVTVDGTSALGPLFSVPVTVTGFTPTAGTSGTTVTVTGTGFSTTAADNLVLFNGQRATIAGATATSLTVTVPATSTGKVAVNVKGSSGTSAGDFSYGSPYLGSLSPQVATTGTKLALEGRFGTSATVNFPGGSSVAATVLGPNRLEVAVPAGATAGTLTVTTSGQTTNAQPFRRATFATGLTGFTPRYAQTSEARPLPTMQGERYQHASLAIGNYLYVLGGSNGTALTSIERASLHADGTLSPFTVVGNMTSPRIGPTAEVIGNYLYIIGGNNGTTTLGSIERASINPDGSLGAFSAVTGVTMTPRYYHTSEVIGRYLYVIGGAGTTTTVERAVINSDGSVTTFEDAGVTLPAGRYGHCSAVVGPYLYLLGNYSGGAPNNSIARASIGADGTLGAFSTLGATLAQGRGYFSCAVIDSALYLFGGYSATYMSSVERATINADGSLGAFGLVSGVALQTARDFNPVVLAGNHLYVVAGGGGTGSGILNTLEHAQINGSGALGAFGLLTPTMTSVRNSFAAAVVGSYVYVTGSYAGGFVNTVERAPINPDGSLGAFQAIARTLNTGRSSHQMAVIGNYLYVIGGAGSGTVLSSIERAPIFADGSIGAFANAGNLSTARRGHTVAVLGGYLYVIAGSSQPFGSVSPLTTVERAAINPDGTLGAFANVGSALGTARVWHSSAVIGNTLYVIGGSNDNGGSVSPTIEQATIGSDGSLGAFSTSGTALSANRYWHSSAVIGSYLYVVGGYTSAAQVERAPIGSTGTLGAFSTVAVSLGSPRIQHCNVLVGGSLYLLGGHNTTLGTNVDTIDRGVLQ